MPSLWTWLASEAWAQETPPLPGNPPPGVELPVLQTFGALFLILGVLLLGFWLLRRYGGRLGLGLPGRGDLRFHGQLALGARRSVVVVQFLDKFLVLGVTDHHITLLTETDVPDEAHAHDAARFASALDDASRDEPGRS